MRKLWIDNLRGFTVILVIIYHVFYIFNNKGALGGVGVFDEDPLKQPQDILEYIVYPWFMMLLFLLAGMSAKYSLETRTAKEFINSRFHKLLIPVLLGPLVYQWITGYINILGSPVGDEFTRIPLVFKWLIFSSAGTGPLWFLQDLLCFSVLLLLVRKLDSKDRFYAWCSKATIPVLLLLGVLVYLGSQVMIYNPSIEQPIHAIINLYRPIAYFVPFLLGYFVFSHDEVLKQVKQIYMPITVCALVTGIALCCTGWGKCYSGPEYLSSGLNCLYAWLMILAMMGIFMKFCDRTNKFCAYVKRTSFGFYVLHYPVVVSLGYLFFHKTSLSPWLIYSLLIFMSLTLTPLLYELFHRIPFIRWAVLGERKVKRQPASVLIDDRQEA